MPITSVTRDPKALTMTVVADFNARLQRLWDAYTDPRQIEKFWGPPEWPATFTRHDAATGGRTEYVMNGPEGGQSRGYWEWLDVRSPEYFEVRNGFAREDGSNDSAMPSMRMTFAFSETEAGSRLVTTTWFNSADELEQLLQMGMEEGMREAMGQIDDVLADLAAFAADRATWAQLLSDTQVRFSRIIRGTPQQVWDAHHDATLLQRWLLGPEGWRMSVCEMADGVGEAYRYGWVNDDGEQFGFVGEILEQESPNREVATEQVVDMDAPASTNEMTLTPLGAGTLLTVVTTYADKETRDAVLEMGVTEGMEDSYRRLEDDVLA